MGSTLKRFISFIAIVTLFLTSALGAFAGEAVQDKGAKVSQQEKASKPATKKVSAAEKGAKATGKASSKKGIKPAVPVAPAAPAAAPVTKASAKAKLDIVVDD